jgi:hypothetical protein
MARELFFDGPEPPPGTIWCAICVGFLKKRVLDAEQVTVSEAQRGSPDQQPVRLNMLRHSMGTELKPAVTRTISSAAPGLGPLDVCWSHAIALDPVGGGISIASPQDAAMLSQAALLNRRPG